MVHRPADSRLLVNLLTHEKDYSKQLAALLDQSQSCLASFSAYASASAPPTSQIIIQVAGALAGADEALRKYSTSLEYWQEQLKSLKGLEDEVGDIMRDREILVTRLIKLSKSQKPTRDSILASSSTSTLAKAPEVQTSTKLASAQSELQACEAHLATKEHELDVMRNVAIKSGLSARCKALVECGWSWGEMGKEGLRALESLEGTFSNGGAVRRNSYNPPPRPYKPLPDGPASDLSSLGPSQSASQEIHGLPEATIRPVSKLYIPPAHAISDHTFPTEEVGQGSSAEEELNEGAYEVRENERFAVGKSRGKQASNLKSNGDVFKPGHSKSSSSSYSQVTPKRQRRASGSVFGSIAAFFHHKTPSEVELHSDVNGRDERQPQKGKWHTRTDKHLARNGKGKADSDSDDDIVVPPRSSAVIPSNTIIPPPPSPPSPMHAPPSTTKNPHKLRKASGGSAARNGIGTALSPVIERRTPNMTNDAAAENEGLERRLSRSKKKPQKKHDQEQSSPELLSGTVDLSRKAAPNGSAKPAKEIVPAAPVAPAPTKHKKQNAQYPANKPNGILPAKLPTEVSISLSRNSSVSKRSITSTASAPMNLSALSAGNSTVHPATPPPRHASTSATHRRSASLDVRSGTLDGSPKATSKAQKRNTLSASAPTPPRVGEQSLMSIVEGVTRNNREARAQQDPNRLLFLPKAPPPITESHSFLELEDAPITASPSRIPSTPQVVKEKTPSERSIPLMHPASPPPAPVMHKPSPDLKPLRSALRNTSRSPSPVIAHLSLTPSPPAVPPRSTLRPPPTPRLESQQAVRKGDHPEHGAAWEPEPADSADDGDTSSISSYETSREIAVESPEGMEDEGESTDTPHPTPHPPDASLSPAVPPVPPKEAEGTPGGSQLSQSTNSTATTNSNAPIRRKSVRMSLPPTFSATPPAIDDPEADGGRGRSYDPWSPATNGETNGWRTKIKEPVQQDIWHDSSDSEVEEYRKAKRLLSRVSGKKK